MEAYTTQLAQLQSWLAKAPGVELLTTDYSKALQDAAATAARLAKFLGAPFDATAAAESVDPDLQRQERTLTPFRKGQKIRVRRRTEISADKAKQDKSTLFYPR